MVLATGRWVDGLRDHSGTPSEVMSVADGTATGGGAIAALTDDGAEPSASALASASPMSRVLK